MPITSVPVSVGRGVGDEHAERREALHLPLTFQPSSLPILRAGCCWQKESSKYGRHQ